MGAICSAPDKGNTTLVELPDQDTRCKLAFLLDLSVSNSPPIVKEEIKKFEGELEKNELKGFQIN